MKKLLTGVAAAAAALLIVPAGASNAQEDATVMLLHGIPDTPVDVAVDGAVVIEGFEFGDMQDLSGFAGQTLTNLEVRLAGTTDVAIGPVADVAQRDGRRPPHGKLQRVLGVLAHRGVCRVAAGQVPRVGGQHAQCIAPAHAQLEIGFGVGPHAARHGAARFEHERPDRGADVRRGAQRGVRLPPHGVVQAGDERVAQLGGGGVGRNAAEHGEGVHGGPAARILSLPRGPSPHELRQRGGDAVAPRQQLVHGRPRQAGPFDMQPLEQCVIVQGGVVDRRIGSGHGKISPPAAPLGNPSAGRPAWRSAVAAAVGGRVPPHPNPPKREVDPAPRDFAQRPLGDAVLPAVLRAAARE